MQTVLLLLGLFEGSWQWDGVGQDGLGSLEG